jgi:ATP-dependent helicase HrpB
MKNSLNLVRISSLPIVDHLAAIASGVEKHPVSIIQAPPGSGKTTIAPLYLAQQPWLNDKKILVLQPRRLAAKSVAARMSELLDEPIGESVGYQIRLESKRSRHTQIEVITEGLLTRRLVSDPELAEVGLIIFDEFHERSVHADVGLALAREVLASLRPDLRIVVMSATLNALLDDAAFSDCWRYSFDTSPHPVEIRYTVTQPRRPVWESVAQTISAALRQYQGDILAFLPGAFEIERCREYLEQLKVAAQIFPLYGELPFEQQRSAIMPIKGGARRIVLATPIAETSLTIEGVRVVVDSGLHKVARSDIAGITDLKPERISLDSADQRAGRAGRIAPGVCIRLWSEQEHKTLRPNREPEVLRTDLTQTLLELATWGVRDFEKFSWITPPPQHAINAALDTLRALGALHGTDCTVTPFGRELTTLGTHPRLAAMCVKARSAQLERFAAAIIPLLEERTPNSRTRNASSIIPLIEDLLSGPSGGRFSDLFRRWLTRIEALPVRPTAGIPTLDERVAPGYLLACAFPERIARRRSGGDMRYLLASGKGVTLAPKDPLSSAEYIVVAAMHSRDDDGVVTLAAPLDAALFQGALEQLVSTHEVSGFDAERGALSKSIQTRIGAILLREDRRTDLSRGDRLDALTHYLRTSEGHAKLPFTPSMRELQSRAAWASSVSPHAGLPDICDDALRASEPFWLSGFLPDNGSLQSLKPDKVEQALRAILSWELNRELQSIAPETLQLPNGRQRRISYNSVDGPVVEAMIQELFGLHETPLIGRCKIPATVHLLSPARRPMQVTKDLKSFWKIGYPEIRKELRGRYPKHRWPEDPETNR